MASLIALVLEHHGADLTRVKTYGWRSMQCPYHNDHVASARVNLELGAFRCLACDASGDALKLISKREGVSREDAEKWAVEEFGANVTQIRKPANERKARHRRAWRD